MNNNLSNPTVALRPSNLSHFIGQDKVKNILNISIAGARARREMMGHVLFAGPPGLGKTTLANIIAAGTETKLITASGPSLTKIPSLATILNQLDDHSTLFIDEIHRMSRSVEEALYSVMEDFRLDVTTKDLHMNMRIPRFTLVGATTRYGMLTKPLRDRFIHQHHLSFYSVEEIAQIIIRSAQTLQLVIDETAAHEIAIRSKQTPRIANNFLLQSRDFALAHGANLVSFPIVLGMMAQLEIDSNGLTATDRKILLTIANLFKGGPVGIDTLSSVLIEEPDVIEEIYEPYLVQQGMLLRTARGRVLSELGYKTIDVGLPVPASTTPKSDAEEFFN